MAADPEQGPTSAAQGARLDHSTCLRDGVTSGAVASTARTITKASTKAAHAGTRSLHGTSTTPYRVLVLGLLMILLQGAQGFPMPPAAPSAPASKANMNSEPARMWDGTPSIIATSGGEIKAISDGEIAATSSPAEIQVGDEPVSKLGSIRK